MKKKSIFLIALCLQILFTDVYSQHKHKQAISLKANNVLVSAEKASSVIKGYLGAPINACIDNRVMSQDLNKIITPYIERKEKDYNGWRCEYWGKWYTSAILGASYHASSDNLNVINEGLSQLLKTQTPDGYIGTYKPQFELEGWDMWGRKYVLLGLIANYDLTGNKAALDAACKELDHLMTQVGPGKLNIADNGLDLLKGLSSNSILEPVVLLYQRTGNRKYEDFANYIVEQWEKPSRHMSKGLQLVRDGIDGIDPVHIASPKAYEMMSCYEGLCEMYRSTGNRKYLDAVLGFANMVIKKEIMITGSGSNQELWADGVRLQTNVMEQPMETCVTATWLKLCYQLLQLTGDVKWADEMEITLYNALLGAMTPDGSWWSYYSPLAGERVPSTFQHKDVELSCCVANGPRGLLLVPKWAVMQSSEGIAINLYNEGTYVQPLKSGTVVTINQYTEYPEADKVTLSVNPQKASVFSIDLRIPAWSKQNSLKVNGKIMEVTPGTYVKIQRLWKAGDKIELQLDLRGRLIPAPSGAPELAVMRGPIVLAVDSRLMDHGEDDDAAVWLIPGPWDRVPTVLVPNYEGAVYPDKGIDKVTYIDLKPASNKPAGIKMAYEAEFLIRPTHFVGHRKKTITLCDYASAGNAFSENNTLRVWLPQPMLLNDAFPQETWKLYYPKHKERPEMPVFN